MDKRRYSRISIYATGIFYLKKNETPNREFSGTINDISECGFKVTIDTVHSAVLHEHLNEGDSFDFIIVDEYNLFGEHKARIVRGVATIVRKVYNNDILEIGCQFPAARGELLSYISDKRTISFMASLRV